ncbi:MAG: hypothetical protein G3H99_07280 [Ferrovum sp.]|nr:hypothetical protein [Ferrovum sp.]NDU87083.1 hypothetical protein [Ferrovum sp.]
MKIFAGVALSWLLACGLAGCAEYQGDPRFGDTVRQNIATQTVNPQGIPALAPVGLDGAATKSTIDNYIYSYMHPQSLSTALSVGMGATGPSAPTAAPVAVQNGSY